MGSQRSIHSFLMVPVSGYAPLPLLSVLWTLASLAQCVCLLSWVILLLMWHSLLLHPSLHRHPSPLPSTPQHCGVRYAHAVVLALPRSLFIHRRSWARRAPTVHRGEYVKDPLTQDTKPNGIGIQSRTTIEIMTSRPREPVCGRVSLLSSQHREVYPAALRREE